MGPVESVPGTAEPPEIEPMTVVPCDEPQRIEFEEEPESVVMKGVRFPSGTARLTEGERVTCAVCGKEFYTELMITMDDIGAPVCDDCREKED